MNGDVLRFLEAAAQTMNAGFVLDAAQAEYVGCMFGVDGPLLAMGMLWRFAAPAPRGQA